MIRVDQIPDEVVEAASFYLPAYHSRNMWPYVRASIAAALNAWPGVLVEWHSRGPVIILPLPKEASE